MHDPTDQLHPIGTGHINFALAAAGLAYILLALASGLSLLLTAACVGVFSVAILCSHTGYRSLVFMLTAALPLSVNWELGDSGSFLRIPSELLIVVVAMAFLLRHFFIAPVDRRLQRHPVTLLLLLLLLVQFGSAATSTMPEVSLKAMVIKTLYIVVFYFACAELFLAHKKSTAQLYLLYLLPLFGVIVYTILRHADFGFSKSFAFTAPEPFFADHTIYSICLVFILPVCIAFIIQAKSWFHSRFLALFFLAGATLIAVAILLSSSRAAWLSLAMMLLAALILQFRIRTWHLAGVLIAIVIYGVYHMDDVNLALRSNRHDSGSVVADLETQARSITNITNDNSNAERINRWKAALRMTADKPWTGFGPGTYQFQYLDYQKPEDLTAISITSPWHVIKGRGGTAHNEFLLVLSESGMAAGLLFVLLVAVVVFTASRTFRKLPPETFGKNLLLTIYLGWISYVCHSFFNNFLDTDKAAFLFYSAMAVIVVLDLDVTEGRRLKTEDR